MNNSTSELYLKTVQDITLEANQNPLQAVIEYLASEMADLDRERLYVIAVDDNLYPLNMNLAHIGTLDGSIAEIRDVLKPVLLANGSGVILLHNHPSGDVIPSQDDKDTTTRLYQACRSLGLVCHDHYVVGKNQQIHSIMNKTVPLLTNDNHTLQITVPQVDVRVSQSEKDKLQTELLSRDQFKRLVNDFVPDTVSDKVYMYCLGTKLQLLSVTCVNSEAFEDKTVRQQLLKRAILSNGNRVAIVYSKSLINTQEFYMLERLQQTVEKEFNSVNIRLIDAFIHFNGKVESLHELYIDFEVLKEYMTHCSKNRRVAEQNIAYQQIKDLETEPEVFTKEKAKAMSILDVCVSLGMNMIKQTQSSYYWDEHDSFKIDTHKNIWHWFSQDIGGDVIKLVQTIQDVSFKDAMHYLKTGEFPKVSTKIQAKEAFKYTLLPYEKDFASGRTYLKEQRSLSDETIDFFYNQGILALADKKSKDGYIEPVIVFKNKDTITGDIIGASLQGIVRDKKRHKRGYLKQIMYGSNGNTGFNVTIGKPNRVMFFESPIDLMSYYELYQDKLKDIRLVSMEGLKESVVAHYFVKALEYAPTGVERDRVAVRGYDDSLEFMEHVIKRTTYFDDDNKDVFENRERVILSVDNDKAGREWIAKMSEKGMYFVEELPQLEYGQDKIDWNDVLKKTKEKEMTNSKHNDNKNADTTNEKESWLSKFLNNITFTVEPKQQMIIGGDKIITAPLSGIGATENNAVESMTKEISENENNRVAYQTGQFTSENDVDVIEKANHTTKAPGTNQEQIIDRSNGSMGSLQPKAEGSTVPDTVQTVPFEQTVTSHPTFSYPLLHFTTRGQAVSKKVNYNIANDKELKKVNLYAGIVQQIARWYKENVADSKIIYFYQSGNNVGRLDVTFNQDNFIHLTGIRPYNNGQNARGFVDDFIQGKGDFDSILLNFSVIEKLQVLPLLPEILDANSFVLDDISTVEKSHRLDLSKAIKTEDKDLLLLFKDTGETVVPASLMKIKGNLKIALDTVLEKHILGVYREHNGELEQLSINENYIKDGGKELMRLLNNSQETIQRENSVQENIVDVTIQHVNISQVKEQAYVPANKSVSDYIADKDLKGLTQHLKDGIAMYTHSEQYKLFLNTMSKFYHYSLLNIQMILSQNPNATMIASYNDWIRKFDRHVNKGERGLKIRVPVQVTKKDEDGNIVLDKNGKPETEIYFKIATVFDVSQTDGKELPNPTELLENDVLDYQNLYRATRHISQQNGVSISFEDTGAEVNGYYDRKQHKIVISNRGMSEAQIMKTLFHEMAHSTLHQNGNSNFHSEEYARQEFEAESIAYVVSNHYGIDTSSYSFAYLHSWVDNKLSYEDFEKSLYVIQQEAKNMITSIDKTLEKIKTQTLQKDGFQQKLDRAKLQQQHAIAQKSETVDVKKSQVTTLDK